jgi:hypothetical protein
MSMSPVSIKQSTEESIKQVSPELTVVELQKSGILSDKNNVSTKVIEHRNMRGK